MKQTYIHPSGNPKAKLAICGEQPGFQEVRAGKPFVGPAGQGLDDCLKMAGILRSELYITNVIKDLDAPLARYINIAPNGKSTISKEGYQYIEELGEELRALDLNCIVALGNIALLALTNRTGITKWRGSIIESTIVPGLKVIPTFHPSTFIPPKFNYLNKPLITMDLERAKKESTNASINTRTRYVVTSPTYDESIRELNNCISDGRAGKTIDVDIEVINEELDCFSVCRNENLSMSIPLRYDKGDYFTVEQELEILKLLGKIISDERIAKRGANFIFDTQFLFHKYGMEPKGELHCTQIAQKIAFPDFNAGLDFVTSMHTDIPYYKADGKKWMKTGTGTWKEWWTYNGMDTISTAAAHPNQIKELEKQLNIETYDRQRKLIKPLIYMSERGIKIDVDGMLKLKNKEQAELDKLIENLHEEVGYEINPNSPAQLKEYFYGKSKGQLGLKPYKAKGANGYTISTNVDALKRISRQGYKAAQIMLDIRSRSKRISTYLNINKVDKDGRYRSSYKPVGAETGRLASGETIFGTGGNQQNWPHDLLRFFLFDDGYIGYSFDLSQIENRIVAYVGGVISQIEAFERGIDLHSMTASVIFNKPYDQVSDEEGSCSLGDGRKSERDYGKKGNHATNYDTGYKTFALKNEMPEAEAKMVLERIHRGYPQIRGGYHILIQNMLKESRIVTNLFGRRRLFLGPIFPSSMTPTSACMDTYRAAYAHFAQSSCADKINEQGVEFIYYNQDKFEPIELLTQIHDSVVFQIPLSIPWREHAKMLFQIKRSLETPLYWKGIEIKTPCDLAVGLNMYKKQMVELKSKKFPADEESLAVRLEEIYKQLIKEEE